ncbi:ATP synthase F1 subunit gamma [Halocola ammonii]
MAGLKEIRSRITSVNSTRQITSAMKMVSAAKLRRAQEAIERMHPYAEKLRELLENVSASLDDTEGVYSKQREVKKVLLVAITSNRGLSGAFNNNIIKTVKTMINDDYMDADVSVVTVGKKAYDALKRTPNYTAEGQKLEPNEIFDDLSFDNVKSIAEPIMEQFVDEKWDRVVLVYNHFINAAVQQVQKEQFLPIKPAKDDSDPNNKSANSDYIFEPNKEDIVRELIPKSLKIQFYKAILDSWASEHGARMTAMHKATDNAGDLLKELKLTYNKARQTSITNEILEIVSGAEALNG